MAKDQKPLNYRLTENFFQIRDDLFFTAQEAKAICPTPKRPCVTLEGEDGFGNSRRVDINLGPNNYKLINDALLKIISSSIKVCEERYAKIPNAKIITVDFKNKKIDPDKRPKPLFRPKYDQLPNGATSIYPGRMEYL